MSYGEKALSAHRPKMTRSHGNLTLIARNVSFALCTKYSRKLYELNERAVRSVEPYRRKMDSQVGGAMVLCESERGKHGMSGGAGMTSADHIITQAAGRSSRHSLFCDATTLPLSYNSPLIILVALSSSLSASM